MRRSELEILDKSIIEDILNTNTVCRIGLVDGSDPYIVPMSYGYTPDCIYLHAALEGKKLDVLEKNNRVCFEVSDSVETIPAKAACSFSVQYRSVIGFGKAELVSNPAEKQQGLQVVMQQHTGKSEWAIPLAALQKVAVIKITIESMTGKQKIL
ncbi:MAG: pyridoxamine 5'-phosphate oxidase family protein [Bacteroidetes bacterium]|nr:pyridoxamine 5'-phosphate oxidase family protein [Bacteroidota bacterium]